MKNNALQNTLLLILLAIVSCAYAAENNSNHPVPVAKTAVESHLHAAMPDYPPTSVEMKLIKVSEHVYYVQGQAGVATDNEGFISNAGVVLTEEGVVLFDALGTPSLAYQLQQKIREITTKPVIKVIVSHYHADHFYGLQVFKDMGAEIIAAKGVEQYLGSDDVKQRLLERRSSLAPWVNDSTRIVAPDVAVDRQSDFTLGGVTFKVTSLGKNHSHDDTVMQVLPDNVLFVGDLVFEQRIPFVVTGDSEKWLDTLANMKLENVNVIVPGHGAASNNPINAVAATKSYLGYLRATMQKAVEDMLPFDEAYNVDWSKYQHLPAFKQANRRNAYSVYLSLEAASMGGN